MILGFGNKMESNEVEHDQIKFQPINIDTMLPQNVNSHITNQIIKPINANAQNYDVVYTLSDGNKLKRSGGTRAWRNNNPGCIRYSDFARKQGAIGKAGGFAVFPDEDTGKKAIASLLKSDKYNKLTIAQAIFKYAPPHENDTENYKNMLRRMTGIPINTRISDLTDSQMVKVVFAIKIIEGWKKGKETLITTKEKNYSDTLQTFVLLQNQKINNFNQKTM